MSSFIQETITNSLEYNDVVNQLQDYMLYDANIQKALRQKIGLEGQEKRLVVEKNNYLVEKNKKETSEKIFVPSQQDTLFWCYYIMINGDIAYETMPNKNSLIAKQLKIDLVSLIRKSKEIIKTYKFDTITNIENNLANDSNLNAKTFLTLCTIANLNIIYISKKTYFESFMNDTNLVYIVREQNLGSKYVKKYGYQIGSEEMINNIRDTLYKLDKIDKPIKAMSAYKVEELNTICKRLAIETINKETGKNKTKKDLYEEILQYF
jgi:ribosomal protein L33